MKTIKVWSVYLTLVLLFAFCHHPTSTDPTVPLPPASQVTDYAVYSAVITYDCLYYKQNRNLYLIDNQTIKPHERLKQYINDNYSKDSISTNPIWRQFVSTVDTSQFSLNSLSNSFSPTCYQTQLLTGQQKATYFSPGASRSLEELRKEFPDFSAVLQFSSVVYSADGTKAVCYRAVYCGFDCAWGSAYLVERKPTGWRVVREAGIWTT